MAEKEAVGRRYPCSHHVAGLGAVLVEARGAPNRACLSGMIMSSREPHLSRGCLHGLSLAITMFLPCVWLCSFWFAASARDED